MASQAVINDALATCDGVIKITENEMLVQGVYVTSHVVDGELADEGAICGGRNACLVGSIFLANGLTYMDIYRATIDYGGGVNLPSFFSAYRWQFMENRPSLKLAYEAFNEAAFEIIEREHGDHINRERLWSDEDGEFIETGEIDTPSEDWAEFFFERVLEGLDEETINAEVVRVALRAKEIVANTGVG